MKKQVLDLTTEEFVRLLLDVEERYELDMKVYGKDGSVDKGDVVVGTYEELHELFTSCKVSLQGTPAEKNWEDILSYIEQNLFDYDLVLGGLDVYNFLENRTDNFKHEKVDALYWDMVYCEPLIIGDLMKIVREADDSILFEDGEIDHEGSFEKLKGEGWRLSYYHAIELLQSKISSPKRLQPAKVTNTFSGKIIHENKDSTLKLLHSLIDGKRGKIVALVLIASVEAGIIQKPTYREVKAEFGDIGAESGFNKYMDKSQFSDAEFNGMLNRLARI